MEFLGLDINFWSALIILVLGYFFFWFILRKKNDNLKELKQEHFEQINKLEKYQNAINEISRVAKVESLKHKGVQHMQEEFDFEYAAISFIDFKSRRLTSFAKNSIAEEWVGRSDYHVDDLETVDILLEMLRNRASEPIYVFGRHVLPNESSITFENLNKKIFNDYNHKQKCRVFVPLLYRNLEFVSKDKHQEVGQVRNDDIGLGVVEVGYDLKRDIDSRDLQEIMDEKFYDSKIRSLFIYADNLAQLYFKNYLVELKEGLRRKLSKASISNLEGFLNQSLEIIIKEFSLECGIVSLLDISSTIHFFDKETDFHLGYSESDLKNAETMNNILLESQNDTKGIFGICNRVIKLKDVVLENRISQESNGSDIQLPQQGQYIELKKGVRSEIGVPVVTPDNSLIAVLILSSEIPVFFNKLHVMLLEYYGQELGARLLSSKRYASTLQLNRPINLFKGNIIENLLNQVGLYFNTKNILFWERKIDNGKNVNIFRLKNLSSPYVLNLENEKTNFVLGDYDNNENYLGNNINLGYVDSKNDKNILIRRIDSGCSNKLFRELNLEKGFESFALLRISFNNRYQYLITIFSQKRLEQNSIEEYAGEFSLSLRDKFEDSLQIQSLFDIALNSNFNDEKGVYTLIAETILGLLQANVVGFMPVNNNGQLDIKNSYFAGSEWEEHGNPNNTELSNLILEKGSRIFNNHKEIAKYFKSNVGKKISEEDFLLKANINSIAGIRLSKDGVVLGVLMIEFKKSNEFKNQKTKDFVDDVAHTSETLIYNFVNVRARIVELERKFKESRKEESNLKNEKLELQNEREQLVKANIELKTLGAAAAYFDIFQILNHEILNLFADLAFEISSTNLAPSVKADISRIEKRINTLLDMFNSAKTSKEFFDINELILNLGILQQDANANINFQFGLDKNLPKLKWNKAEFSIIIHNILNNAIYVLRRKKEDNENFHPEISIETKYTSNQMIEISIEDNGPGIRKEIINRIFDLNFSTKTKAKNGIKDEKSRVHGIGLYFVKNALYNAENLWSSDIYCESEFGNGTKFTISIPEYLSYLEETSQSN